MHLLEFFCIAGIVFLILEILIPSMFFLNFALAAFIVAPVTLVTHNISLLVIIFFILSFASFYFLRPILINKFSKDKETGINSKYIGKTVKAEEEINFDSGVITIYGERWEARSDDGSVIPKDSNVKIVRNESLIMYVQKV